MRPGHNDMRQVIENVLGNHQAVIPSDDAGVRVDEDAGAGRVAQGPAMSAFPRRQATPLSIAAVLLATAWSSEACASQAIRYPLADARAQSQPKISISGLDFHEIERMRATKGLTAGSVRLAQAAPDDRKDLKTAPEQGRYGVELVAAEQAIKRRIEMLLTLRQARAEAARSRQVSEGGNAELQSYLQQERARLKNAAETGAGELCRALPSDRAEQSERVTATDTIELRTSLQQQHDRADHLEQDLAAAKRELTRQAAQLAEVSEQASQAKQQGESDVAELRTSLEHESGRAAQLQEDLAAARRELQTQTELASKANEYAGQSKRAESEAVELRASLQQERDHAAQLEKDLASARRDVEAQTTLAAKANQDAARSKQAADDGFAELKRSLQKERDRAGALAENLSMVHTAIYTYEVQARMANGQVAARARSAASSTAELQKSLQQEQARAARLQQDVVAARRDVDAQTALAAKAGAEAARLKQAADDSSIEYLKSLQQERDKAARLERELAAERKTKDVPATSGVVARAAQDKQSAMEAIRPIAVNQTAAAGARSNAKPGPENAAEVARMVARASVLLGQGDIGSARIVLERAVEAGDAQASFALAETYDPFVLSKWGAYGTLGDPAKARDLYAKAQAGGLKEAKERFDALRR